MPRTLRYYDRPAPQAKVELPQLRRDQYAIALHPAKVKVVAMGRRWGKTVLGFVLAMLCALAGGRVAWIVPLYKNGAPLWRMLEKALKGLEMAGAVRIRRADRTIDFLTTGGYIGIYSADNPDSILGENFSLVILDEAARIAREVWEQIIQPTLADQDGDAILISTPKGRTWFYYEWMRGYGPNHNPRYKSFTAPSSANPNPNIQEAARRAKDLVPDDIYRQEWLAEFLESSGSVFRKINEACTAKRKEIRLPHHRYVGGVDWGKEHDYTVVTIFDATTRQMVDYVRFNQMEWYEQRQRIKGIYDKWKLDLLVAEDNFGQDVNIAELQGMGLSVLPFSTTPLSKPRIIIALALALEKQANKDKDGIELLNDEILKGELLAYTKKQMPSGAFQYGAPSGLFDDMVMSTAIGFWAVQQPEYGGIHV